MQTTNPLAHDSPTPVFQEGIRPSTFKALIGKGHEEFSTMRQQDSEEFFSHFLTTLRRQIKKPDESIAANDPTQTFRFGLEQRLQCQECRKVRYRVDSTDVLSVPVPQRPRSSGTSAAVDDTKPQFDDVKLQECVHGKDSIAAEWH